MFQPTIAAVVRGDPEAILFVEFAENDQQENIRRLKRLGELIGDLGLAWDKGGAHWGGVVDVLDARLQTAITEVRTAPQHHDVDEERGQTDLLRRGLRGPLEHLAEYTSKLTDIFAKHGTRGTWYAHASVGCLHVRPVLKLAARQGCKGDARHRRGGVRTRARLQGSIPANMATASCVGVSRADVRVAARARV